MPKIPNMPWGKVLIVDDDPVILMIHRLKVVKCGLDNEPLEFVNGSAALNYLLEHRSNGKNYLVLLDINMPVMNGWEFLDSIGEYELKPKVDVAIVTSSVNHEDKEKAAQYSDVFSYLIKPITEDDLKALIEE